MNCHFNKQRQVIGQHVGLHVATDVLFLCHVEDSYAGTKYNPRYKAVREQKLIKHVNELFVLVH